MEEIDCGRISWSCRQICIQMERLVNRFLDQEGLTAVQAHVLQYILHRGQGTSLTEIHRELGCSMATLSCIVKRLKEKGYVRAECCVGDDRYKLLFATEKGQQAQKYLDGVANTAQHQMYSCFSQDELVTLNRLQRKLLQNILSLIDNTQKEASEP